MRLRTLGGLSALVLLLPYASRAEAEGSEDATTTQAGADAEVAEASAVAPVDAPPEDGATPGSDGVVPTPAGAERPALDLAWHPPGTESDAFVAREQSAAVPGTLKIVCDGMSVGITLDGERLGTTPLTVAGLEPGVHEITVEAPSGVVHTTQVFVPGGTVQELAVRPVSSTQEQVAIAMRTISTILSVLAAIPAGATPATWLAREPEMPGLITNFDVIETGGGDQ